MTLTYRPDANHAAPPKARSRRGPKTAASQSAVEAQSHHAGGADIPDATPAAGPNQDSRPGTDPAAPVTNAPPMPEPGPSPALLDDTLLYFAAADLDAIESARRACSNRLTVLTTPKYKLRADGKAYGHGRTLDDPLVQESVKLLDRLKKLEEEHVRHLERLMRKHPLGPWVKAHVGIGEKQAARLLGSIGDPYWNGKAGRPRTIYELYAYCGLKPGQRLRKGMKANWSTDAKTRTWLIAKQVVIQNGAPDKNRQRRGLSPYRAVYDNRRAHTAVTHPEWEPLHSHNDALHIVSKEILKDLWLTARDLHQAAGTEVAT